MLRAFLCLSQANKVISLWYTKQVDANDSRFFVRSRHLTYFHQHGQAFAFHNLFGYILGMSPDLVGLLEFHRGSPRSRTEVKAAYHEHFSSDQLDEFLKVFELFSCIVESELAEERLVWDMVPVRSRWLVFHQPDEQSLQFWRTDRNGHSSCDEVPPWGVDLWASFDGERTLGAIYDDLKDHPGLAELSDPRDSVWRLITEWIHHSRQYLKLAKRPLSTFGAEHQWPSYLRSTMPYAVWSPDSEPISENPLESIATPINPPHSYYEHDVDDAQSQFDDVETTLSHLFRGPSPLLAGASYAERVIQYLINENYLKRDATQLLEVGGGMGHLAAGILSYLKTHESALYDQLSYTIVDLSPALRSEQLAQLKKAGVEDKVKWISGNVETLTLPENSVDLLISNEVIGDFTTVKLTHESLNLDQHPETNEAIASWSSEQAEALGKAGALLKRYGFPLRDAPEEFYFNVGAIEFISKIEGALRQGGTAFVTEYGELMRFPVPGTHLDHIEFSIHFGFLANAAKQEGLEVVFEYVQNVIGLDLDAFTLETTRTYFASLKAMLASHGVALEKRAYSHQMFAELLDGHIGLNAIGDIRFRKIDERCMGLAPHEFKALIVTKPVPVSDACD